MSYKRNWKGVKWRDTPFAKPHERRMAIRRVFATIVYAQAYCSIGAIRASPSFQNGKAISIVRTAVNAHALAASIMANGIQGVEQ